MNKGRGKGQGGQERRERLPLALNVANGRGPPMTLTLPAWANDKCSFFLIGGFSGPVRLVPERFQDQGKLPQLATTTPNDPSAPTKPKGRDFNLGVNKGFYVAPNAMMATELNSAGMKASAYRNKGVTVDSKYLTMEINEGTGRVTLSETDRNILNFGSEGQMSLDRYEFDDLSIKAVFDRIQARVIKQIQSAPDYKPRNPRNVMENPSAINNLIAETRAEVHEEAKNNKPPRRINKVIARPAAGDLPPHVDQPAPRIVEAPKVATTLGNELKNRIAAVITKSTVLPGGTTAPAGSASDATVVKPKPRAKKPVLKKEPSLPPPPPKQPTPPPQEEIDLGAEDHEFSDGDVEDLRD